MDTQMCLGYRQSFRRQMKAMLVDDGSRLSTCWKANHDDRYSTRVEQPSRHGTVELGRGQALVLWHIVDGVDEGRALATIPRCICRNLGRSGAKVSYHGVVDVAKFRPRHECVLIIHHRLVRLLLLPILLPVLFLQDLPGARLRNTQENTTSSRSEVGEGRLRQDLRGE